MPRDIAQIASDLRKWEAGGRKKGKIYAASFLEGERSTSWKLNSNLETSNYKSNQQKKTLLEYKLFTWKSKQFLWNYSKWFLLKIKV